jgi:hypothetical protein
MAIGHDAMETNFQGEPPVPVVSGVLKETNALFRYAMAEHTTGPKNSYG